MALTLDERARVRYHLGYLNVDTPAALALGVVSASHSGFLVESTMNTLKLEAEPLVRRFVLELDCIDVQLSKARTRLSVSEVANVKLRGPEELEALEDQYSYWAKSLADTLGVPINPFSLKHQRLCGEVFIIDPA